MDAIDHEPTRKTPKTLAGAQAQARARAEERATARLSALQPNAPTSAPANDSRLPARFTEAPQDGEQAPVIVPGRAIVPSTVIVPHAKGRPVISRTVRFTAAIVCIAAVIVTGLLYNEMRTSTSGGQNVASSVPQPTGRGPLTAQVGVIVAAPAPQSVHSSQGFSNQTQTATTPAGVNVTAIGLFSIEPCHSSVMFVPNITQWTVPPGCYANVYVPNPANYANRPGFGYCNWWLRVTHPNTLDITEGNYPRGTTPVAGAAIFFDPYEQGAGGIGHWAEAVAVSPDHYWVLISEMNFAWRGAGWAKIDYRYIHVSPHVHFVYGV